MCGLFGSPGEVLSSCYRPCQLSAASVAHPGKQLVCTSSRLKSATCYRLCLCRTPRRKPNNTLNLATDLGHFGSAGQTAVDATIGDTSADPADVDWYQFTLDEPAAVHLTLHGTSAAAPFTGVISLYNNDEFDFGLADDPLSSNFGDLAAPNGHRLLARTDESSLLGPIGIRPRRTASTQTLAAGTYFVAVSGAGNTSFNPFIANSGYAGSTGDYELAARHR